MSLPAILSSIPTRGRFGPGLAAGAFASGGRGWGRLGEEYYYIYRDDGAGVFNEAMPAALVAAAAGAYAVPADLRPALTDTDVKLWVPANGSDGSPHIFDYSPSGHVVRRAGSGAVLDTAQKKFGPSSLYFGASGAATVADSSDWDYGTGDFTISFWLRLNEAPTPGFDLLATTIAGGAFIITFSAGGITCTILAVAASKTVTWATGTWYHIALVRYGNALTCYINGVAGTPADCTGLDITGSAALSLNPSTVDCWLDDFYISHRAEWTAAFTPPATHWGFATRATWNYARAGVGPDGTRGALSAAGAIVVDAAGLIYHDPGPAPVDLAAEARADGKIRLTWHAPAGGATTPDGYIVYRDVAGVWTEQDRVDYGGRSYAWTSAALTNGVEYDFIVRAYRTVSGIDYIEPNTTSVSATADDAGPPAITAVAARMK